MKLLFPSMAAMSEIPHAPTKPELLTCRRKLPDSRSGARSCFRASRRNPVPFSAGNRAPVQGAFFRDYKAEFIVQRVYELNRKSGRLVTVINSGQEAM
jgi:hypothetical protein